jgi:hypothetical protein
MQPRDQHAILRGSLDSNDAFVNGGHGIINTAGATCHARRMRAVPAWALDDEKIKRLILLRYPKAKTDSVQRKLAGRTVRLIYLYYRTGLTETATAEELKMTPNAVRCAITRLSKQMVGNLDRIGKEGRPRNSDTIGPSIGHPGDDDHIDP